MQNITLTEIKAAARDYYARGMLVAQDAGASPTDYLIPTTGRRCAIGAALNDGTLAEIMTCEGSTTDGRMYLTVDQLVYRDYVKLDDLDGATDVQRAHDSWASAARIGDERASRQKDYFLKLIAE